MAYLKSFRLFLIALLSLLQPVMAAAESADAFQFFQEEALVVSASRQPVSRSHAPATVYVVTQEDIQNSGAQTIWEALRGVPGVTVIQSRTDQGEVSIRGLDKPLTNRTLILLDGKSVMNSLFDFATFEDIPVTMQEIDRIEVVEGPASAMYGANAINGVINIITKSPEKMQGGQLSYTGGERNTQIGSFNYGRKQDKLSYKIGGGWRSMNQFDSADKFASEAGKFNALVGYAPTPDSEWSASGGVTNLNTQETSGAAGTFFNDGNVSFARTDFRYRKTKVRTFWNHARIIADQFVALGNANLDSDTFDADIEQEVSLPLHNDLTFGASGRRNSARSTALPPGLFTQDLWALFAEDKWDFADQWSLNASGRLDRHPFTPLMFSPRGSLLYTPLPEHVFRVSAGTSFRNPTILENSISTTLNVPVDPTSNLPVTSIQAHQDGNRSLQPERMEMVEIAHNGHFGLVDTSVVGFHYKLNQIINGSPQQPVGFIPPGLLLLQSSFVNSGTLTASGGQFGVVAHWTPGLSSFANYSYQYLHDDSSNQALALQSPRHKANAGVTAKQGGVTGTLQADWVDKTMWASTLTGTNTNPLAPVSAYFLLNAHLGYAFAGPWKGLEVGVTAFNLLNHDHFEILPPISAAQQGQFGEIVRSRWTGTVSYRF